MTEAIFGLFGVVVGGLLTGAREWVLARRKERGEARAAARRVSAELRDGLDIIGEWLDAGWWAWDYWQSPTVWREEQMKLALTLPGESWSAVQHAYGRLGHIDRSTSRLARAGTSDVDVLKLKSEERAALEADARDVERAVDALAAFTGDPPTRGSYFTSRSREPAEAAG